MPRFLNRLLGLPLSEQQLLFDYFSETLNATIKLAKTEGKYQVGHVYAATCKHNTTCSCIREQQTGMQDPSCTGVGWPNLCQTYAKFGWGHTDDELLNSSNLPWCHTVMSSVDHTFTCVVTLSHTPQEGITVLRDVKVDIAAKCEIHRDAATGVRRHTHIPY